ncbi:ABC transporter ATP-binding protein [Cellulomonas soli]|uniref:ABC transporter domain-containing protein n=1 Tax=Cellulomonas soli TaxID=931535 RepID=A0A512PA27_9CELL|nr:ABC transporter ATP-binding protein [Cellulomonas soli]NYI60543.1 peptide/nickel transport system ATP-binding protein [Cellulomonas soli]GEP68058.1 hypothetical protein CSO01_07730 [Cellulomonas soli]
MALEVRDLVVQIGGRTVVDGVSFTLEAGERLGVIGESGSGKSLTMLAVLGLLPDGARATGSIRWERRELLGIDEHALASVRGREIGIVFQEPSTALDPIRTVGNQIAEPLRIHYGLPRREARQHAVRLASSVALPDPGQLVRRYPHQLSGGQRQRVAIAMALAAGPRLLIADEPTTALDVTVQRGVIELFDELVEASGLSLVFVTHDIALLAQMGGDALVMADGRVVERGPVASLVHAPTHPVARELARAALATGWSPAVHA